MDLLEPKRGVESRAEPEQSAMPVRFSDLGRRFTHRSGIMELMDDLGRATTIHPNMLMLGGGNPAAVPQVQAIWRRQMRQLLAEGDAFDRMLGRYDPPQGNPAFVRSVARLLQESFGWPVTAENIAVTNGTQTAFFFLFNLLAGVQAGLRKKILLPMAPEYIGYADQGLDEGLFVSCRPTISWPQGQRGRVFKYRIDFAAVEGRLQAGDVAAIAVSRPANPTGNVLAEDELRRLSDLAMRHGVLLIVDNAYGVPFPGIVFTDARPHWAPHVINTFSLSKLGLPGVRTGMVVGAREIAAAIESMTAIAGLANGSVGQQLVLPLLESGEILQFGPSVLRPFYEQGSREAQRVLHEFFGQAGVDWAVHLSEGAFFLWVWLRGLKITTAELYQRLKQRHVLVVPGEHFFYGLPEPWPHQHQCLRISFAQPLEVVREGLRRIAEEVQKAT